MKLKAILHRKHDGGIAFEYVSPNFVSLLTSNGYGGDPAYIAEQSRRLRIPDEAGKVLFSNDLADRWSFSVANGDMSESAVYALLVERAKSQLGFTDSVLVEQSELESALASESVDRDSLVYDTFRLGLHTSEID